MTLNASTENGSGAATGVATVSDAGPGKMTGFEEISGNDGGGGGPAISGTADTNKRTACANERLEPAAYRAAVELEEKRLRVRCATAGQDEDRVNEIVANALWNECAFMMVDVSSAHETFLEGDTKASPNLRVGAHDPKTGGCVIHCNQLRKTAHQFAHLPGLNPDATLRSALTAPVLDKMCEVMINAMAPHIPVTLVSGPFGKSKLRDGLKSGPGLKSRVRAMGAYPRWHCLSLPIQ